MFSTAWLIDALGARARALLLLPLCQTILACAPQIEPYRYIDFLPVDGLSTDLVAGLDQPEVWFAGKLPLRWILRRDAYAVVLANDPPSVLPGITIALTADTSAGIRLRPNPSTQGVSPAGNICASYYPLPGNVEIEFGWSADCLGKDLPMTVEFDVLDTTGAVIGNERLNFSLSTQGWYVLKDFI
jgi:hypothetical protein